MDDLPFELVDKILSYLDGLSLARSVCVCRKWRHLHEQNHYNSLWRNACFKEFASEALDDIIGYALSKYNDRNKKLACEFDEKENENLLNSNVNWKEVYKECYRSWFIGKWPSLGTELRGHSGQVYDAKFSGDRVVTCGADATIRIWDSWTGSCLTILQGHQQEVVCLALRRKTGVSSHGDHPHDLIISGSEDYTVCVWDMEKGKCLKRLRQSSRVNSVAVRGSIVVAGCGNNYAEVWDISKDNDEWIITVNAVDWITYVGFWNDFFVTVTDKNTINFWSFSGDYNACEVNRTNTDITCAAIRGDRTLTLSYGGKLSAWQHRLVDGEINSSILRCYTIIAAGTAGILEGTCIAIYGSLVAIGTRHGMINVYHLDRDWDKQFQLIHTVIHSSDLNMANFNAIDISDDGTGPTLLTAGQNGIVRVERWFPWPRN